ncbi:MAG: sialate O-acetylesterase [Fimbriimonas sp.]
MIPFIFTLAMQEPSLKLPSIFADNMVLQRDVPIPFFGTGRPGQKVTVALGTRTAETVVGADGSWMAKLKAMPAGGPYVVRIDGGSKLQFRNVLVGEVWVASGQSNMEWRQNDADDLALALKETDPYVRMFTADHVATDEPQKEISGSWAISSKVTVPGFSAVGNAFAKQLQKALGVPVGIIHTSWGGTPAESWTSREMLLKHPKLAYYVNNYMAGMKDYPARKAAYDKALAEWTAEVYRKDPGNKGFDQGWANAETAISDWKPVKLPATLEALEGPMDGAVWYRRTFDLPASWSGKDLLLELGPIDDFDVTYVNGQKVGETDDKTRLWYASPRQYRVPASALHAGSNVVAVRVYDHTGAGGFTGIADQMKLTPVDKSAASLSLAGDWRSKVEVRFEPPSQEVLNRQPQAPFGPGNPWAPSSLYNAMIAPLVPYAIRGAIWYQGESNAGKAFEYRELFPAMIQDWRNRWGQGNFPFYFVQLANFTARNELPVESDWAELREAQSITLRLPNTGQAVTIDIGEANDIHPRNKREVGRRLALNALARTYGVKVAFSGPVFESAVAEGNKMRLRFSHAEGLRSSDEGPLVGFAVAGADRKFKWARADVEGDTIIVRSPEVARPVAVRYGWSNNPGVNLVNGAGLPASPFRSDDWPGVTQPK